MKLKTNDFELSVDSRRVFLFYRVGKKLIFFIRNRFFPIKIILPSIEQAKRFSDKYNGNKG
jgi:hypothetical protein